MKYILTAVFVLLAIQARAVEWKESHDVGGLFKKAGISGTFVLYNVAANRYTGHDKSRAETSFVPASTFKIPNALIGLSTGAVKDVDEILPYGGKPQPFKAWEKDMGLKEAMSLSNVPIYQHLARRIGLKRMQKNLRQLDYGNKETGPHVDRFWLDGPLKISAIEQTRFLAALAQGSLPFSKQLQESVREIVLIEKGEGWTLHGKTGWQNAPNAGIGWWVGWVHQNHRVYAFALNVDIREASDADKRVALGRRCLEAFGLLAKDE